MLLTVGAAVLGLACLGVASWRQATQTRERERAATALLTAFEALAMGPAHPGEAGRDVLVGDRLVQMAGQIPEVCKGLPSVEAEVWTSLGRALMSVERYADAERAVGRAAALRTAGGAAGGLRVLRDRSLLALIAYRMGRDAEAERLEREVLDEYAAIGASADDQMTACCRLAVILGHSHGRAAALEIYRRAWAISERTPGASERVQGEVLAGMGLYELGTGDRDAAEKHLHDAERLLRTGPAAMGSTRAQTLCNLGQWYVSTGRLADAEGCLREALAIESALGGPSWTDTSQVLSQLAGAYWVAGQLERAEPMFREAVRVCRAGPARAEQLAVALNSLGVCLRDRGKLDEAEAAIREGIAIRRRVLGPEHLSLADPETTLARVLIRTGQHEEARSLVEHAMQLRGRAGASSVELVESLAVLALSSGEDGDCENAARLAMQAVDLRRSAHLERHWRADIAVDALVATLGRSQPEEAQRYLLCDFATSWQIPDTENAAYQRAWARLRDAWVGQPG
jgi:tetratricopeptide (TPR) repeat protein